MRIGVMVGPERGRYATKVERLVADARRAEDDGLASIWIPQIPDDFDALTAAAVIGAATERIEIGTAVVPVQPRHPIALATQALSVQAVCRGRLALGLGVSHHWVIDEMLGLPYERPAATMRAHLDVLDQALAGPGLVEVDNGDVQGAQPDRYHRRGAHTRAAGRAGPGHVAAGRRADRRDHPVDGRRADHRHPRRTDHHAGRRGGRSAGAPHRRRGPRVPVPRRRGRHGRGPHQPSPLRGGDLTELPEAARPRRRPGGGGHPGRRQRGGDREAPAGLRRCRGHRSVGARGAHRGEP